MSSAPTSLGLVSKLAQMILPLDFKLLDGGTVPEGRSFCLRHELENGHLDIECLAQWRTLSVDFQPKGYVAPLVLHVLQMLPPAIIASIPVAYGLKALNGDFQVQSTEDDSPIPPHADQLRPVRSVRLRFSFKNIEVLDSRGEMHLPVVMPRVGACLRVIADVLPLTASVREPDSTGYLEGKRTDERATRYERDPRNRALCIAHHGDACAVCRVRFVERYGDIGAGFIHVHHITPLAHLQDEVTIDPARDLVPVCPNCHNMLHRTDPPMEVTALRNHLRE